jgi:hypothetical protein
VVDLLLNVHMHFLLIFDLDLLVISHCLVHLHNRVALLLEQEPFDLLNVSMFFIVWCFVSKFRMECFALSL